ncbi:hypothetical protein GF345_03610 [Candidatus Woesearchaeota archaeon]|nr:hypothetical protein [Candidatus Woesearchaeota archaeon]
MELKIVISDPKTGKSVQRELKDDAALALKGKRIGDTFKGESIDFTGYEFKITGGSDYAGFPMRKDIPGAGRSKVLEVSGVGVNNKRKYRDKQLKGLRTMKGMRQRKTVAGNTIYAKTAQVNVMITKAGKENLFAEAPAEGAAPEGESPKESESKEAVTEAKPAEEKQKEEAKPEEKKEAPTEDKKEEAPKQEPKAEEKKEEAPEEKPKEETKEEPKPEEKEKTAEENPEEKSEEKK